MWITTREKEILKLSIEIYIKEGIPVSSRMISKKKKNYFSTATIRNDMQSLDEKGYFFQPHPQSGRIPTPKAIKYYIKHFADTSQINIPELGFKSLSTTTELRNFWDSVSDDLSLFSDNIGFILAPSFFSVKFNNLKFIKIGEKKILILIETLSKLTATKVIRTEEDISQKELDGFSSYLINSYRGKSLEQAMKLIYIKTKAKQKKLLEFISFLKKQILINNENFKLYFKGEEKLIEKSVNKDIDRITKLIQLLEDRKKLIGLLKEAKKQDDVNIFFAPLIGDNIYDNFTLIFSDYYCDNEIEGKVGVLGFRRIDYPYVYNLVKKTADDLSEIFYGEKIKN